MRPGTLAVRCVNQYRTRDIVTYLGLRYFLQAACARPDPWSRDVAVEIAAHRTSPVYHRSSFYKETAPTGELEYRELYTPSPNDAMAEAALLGECARLGGPFAARDSVFSYRLPAGAEKRGVFEPYFIGYRARHEAIAQACREDPNAVIIYRDLRRFYPSITQEQAAKAWEQSAATINLNRPLARLGTEFIRHYGQLPGDHRGVVTGPMFSHLIGNLVLAELDEEMQRRFPNRYFRYVDDLVVAVKSDEANCAAQVLEEAVARLRFTLHSEKRLDVPASEWLNVEAGFAEITRPPSWASFIGRMRALLVLGPENRAELERRFTDAGIRILPFDYTSAARERDYQASLFERLRQRWYRHKLRQISPATTVAEGLALRPIMLRAFETACDQVDGAAGFQRKRSLQRLRFACSRLIYLAPSGDLRRIGETLAKVREAKEFEALFRALESRDVGPMLPYGARIAQAAAQPLKAIRETITCTHVNKDWPAASVEALSVLLMNGVKVELATASPPPDVPILRFARTAAYGQSDGSTGAEYFQELSRLHGRVTPARHAAMLASAFDVDETMVFDSEMLRAYS